MVTKLDNLLLGMVDILGTICRYIYCTCVKGRTIKEFILGVLFVPALVCFIFFAVFGASAIYLQDNHIADIAKAATETATFATLQHYPLGFVLLNYFTCYYDFLCYISGFGNLCFRYVEFKR